MTEMKPKWYIEEFTFVLKEYIERVWMFTRDCTLSDLNLDEDNILLEVTEIKDFKNQVWLPEMEFKGRFLKKFEYKGKCVDVVTYPNYKKIKWEFHIFDENLVNVSESLYNLSSSLSTLVLIKLKFSSDNVRKIFRGLGGRRKLENLFRKSEEMLMKNCLNLYQFESCIIRASMENIWSLMTKLNKLKLIAPKAKITCENESDEEEKVGMEKTISILGSPMKYKIRISCAEKNPNGKQWVYSFEPAGEKEDFCPDQNASINIIRVSKDECMVTFTHNFKKYIPFKFIKGLSNEKIYILDSVKDYLENFKNN